jgi:L-threonylcarbamoyladenylate synthase
MKIYKNLNDQNIINALINGGVGIIRTDTVYGIVCSAQNKESVARLYSLKNRTDKAGTIIAASIEQIENLGFVISNKDLAAKFWPGPYSIELNNIEKYRHLSLGAKHQAVRIPNDKIILSLLELTGPLQTTSANQPGESTSKSMEEALSIFGDSVDFYVDGGKVTNNTPSKIIKLVGNTIEYIRK